MIDFVSLFINIKALCCVVYLIDSQCFMALVSCFLVVEGDDDI